MESSNAMLCPFTNHFTRTKGKSSETKEKTLTNRTMRKLPNDECSLRNPFSYRRRLETFPFPRKAVVERNPLLRLTIFYGSGILLRFPLMTIVASDLLRSALSSSRVCLMAVCTNGGENRETLIVFRVNYGRAIIYYQIH